MNSMDLTFEPTQHQVYLLRLWRSNTDKPWRISLIPAGEEEPSSHFTTLASLMAFLQQQAGSSQIQ